VEADQQPAEAGAGLGGTVVGLDRGLLGPGEHVVGALQLGVLQQGLSEPGEEPRDRGVSRRQQVHGPGQEADRGGDVAPGVGAPPGGGQPLRPPDPETPGVVVGRAELDAVAVSLLEVATQDLVELRRVGAHPLLEPPGEALVQVGPHLLGDGPVGGVLDEQVAEPEGVLARGAFGVGHDELLADERLQGPPHLGPVLLGGQLGHRSPLEDLPHHAGPLDQGQLRPVEPLEAGGEQGLDRRRYGIHGDVARGGPSTVPLLEDPVVDEHQKHLLDEQGVALGGLGQVAAGDVLEVAARSRFRIRSVLSVGVRESRVTRVVFGRPAPQSAR
jgi:hypothetical protein